MTRKQALSLAIQALSDTGRNEEAIAVLHTLSDELPLNRWSDAAIRDAVDQFILDHGRVPSVTDFKKRGLPPHPVIEHRYGVTLRQWLDENYPVQKPLQEDIRKRMTEAFEKDYLRIRPKSADEFNAQRTPNSPCWYTVAVHNHTKRWRGLLEKLELPVFNHVDVPRELPAFQVNVMVMDPPIENDRF